MGVWLAGRNDAAHFMKSGQPNLDRSKMGTELLSLAADKRTVMLVDDEPDNLRVLESMLSSAGYRISAFLKGEQAILAALSEPPDLFLLDIRMPGMDGYEVCRTLHAHVEMRSIPVLFISALSTLKDIADGFECGAVDYITKPFKEREVLARVKTHIMLRQAYAELVRQNEALKELQLMRDTLVQMLVHDMRMPIQLILGNLECLCSSQPELAPDVRQNCLLRAMHASRQLGRMVAAVVDVGRIESGCLPLKIERCSTEEIYRRAQDQSVPVSAGDRMRTDVVDGWPGVKGDLELCVRVVANLLDNALRYSASSSDILCSAHAEGDVVKFVVQNRGREIPSCVQAHMFEKYAVSEPLVGQHRFSTGLGLAFCRLAVEAQGGQIGVHSSSAGVNTFWFTLPLWVPRPG